MKNLNFDFFLKLFLLIAPIIWLPGISQNGAQLIFFIYGSILLFFLSAITAPVRECKNFNVLIIPAVCIIVSVINGYGSYPLNFIHVICGCLLYYAIVRSLKDFRGVISILAVICVLNIFAFCLQINGLGLIYQTTTDNPSIQQSHFSNPGLMGRNYHLAYAVTFLAPLFLFISAWAGVLMMAAGLIIAVFMKSFACALASVVSILIGTFFLLRPGFSKKNMATLITGFFIGCAVFFVIHENSYRIIEKVKFRAPVYDYLIKESLVNPFVGRGIGTFETEKNIEQYTSSFNQVLRFTFELGLIPTAVIMISLFLFYKEMTPHPYFIVALSSMLTYPMFHEALRFAKFIVLWIVVFALIEVYSQTKKKELQNEISY